MEEQLAYIAKNREFVTSEEIRKRLNLRYSSTYIRHILNGNRNPVQEVLDAAIEIIKAKAKAVLAAA